MQVYLMDNHCFIFFKDEYPDWCEECEKMEQRIIEGDGLSAIHICGKMGEKISKEICRKENLYDLCNETQDDRNKELNKKGILSNKEKKFYDNIRRKRNLEVHDDKKIKNEMADAYYNHENLYKVSTRFYKKYVDEDFDIPKYVPPKSTFSQETIIEQHSNSHNVNTENSNNTVNITNITHNHNYSQKNELKANKTEVHNNKKSGEEDAMDKKTLIIGIVAILAILVICLSFFTANTDNSSSYVQDTSQVSSSSSDDTAVSSSDDDTSEKSVSSSSSSSQSSGTVYWASEKTDKFHRPECEWAQKISDWNKIVYHSRQEALDSGRQPCEVCNP